MDEYPGDSGSAPPPDEYIPPPPPPPGMGPFLAALIGAGAGSPDPEASFGGGGAGQDWGSTNVAPDTGPSPLDDPRGYGPAYDAPPVYGSSRDEAPPPDFSQPSPTWGQPHEDQAIWTNPWATTNLGDPIPSARDWGSTNAPEASPWGSPTWGDTNGTPTPTATEIPEPPWGLGSWADVAEAAGPPNATATAYERGVRGTATAGAQQDNRTATALAQRGRETATAAARQAAGTETAVARGGRETATAEARQPQQTATAVERGVHATETAQARASRTAAAATPTFDVPYPDYASGTPTPTSTPGPGILDQIGSIFRRATPTPTPAPLEGLGLDSLGTPVAAETPHPGYDANGYRIGQGPQVTGGIEAGEMTPAVDYPVARARTAGATVAPATTSASVMPIGDVVSWVSANRPELLGALQQSITQNEVPPSVRTPAQAAAFRRWLEAAPLVNAPGVPGAVPPDTTVPVTATTRRGAATAPAASVGTVAAAAQAAAGAAGGGAVAISPGVEQHRALYERYFGDLGPEAVTHAMQLASLESGGNAGAHNTNGEDSRGLMQINVGPGGNTQFASRDLFNPEENVRTAREVYDGQGWGAWSTERVLQSAGRNAAMPGAGGAAPATRGGGPLVASPADLAAAAAGRGPLDASMPGAARTPAGAATRGTPPEGLVVPPGGFTRTGDPATDNFQRQIEEYARTGKVPTGAAGAAAREPVVKEPVGPHRGDIPTNKPAASAAPAGPAIATSPSGSYRLSDGNTKTLDEMKTELRGAGWGGDENDVQAVLAAYQRTTGKTLTPAAAVLTPAARQAQVSRWTPNLTKLAAGTNVPADVALAAIDFVSQGDPTHAGGLMGVPASKLPAGAVATDGETSIAAGLGLLKDAYTASGGDWGKAFSSYLGSIGIEATPAAVAAFNERRHDYASPAPAA